MSDEERTCLEEMPAPHTVASDSVPLDSLLTGEQGVVVEMAGGRRLLCRMTSLGFTPGAEVTVVQNFGRGPLIALVRDVRIALGRGEAAKIYVRKDAP